MEFDSFFNFNTNLLKTYSGSTDTTSKPIENKLLTINI